jgi:putative Holliday junction resolvase
MAIDPGTRRIGVAIADDDACFAEAKTTLEYGSDAATARAIAELAHRENVVEIVVGLPIGLDGRENLSSLRSRALAAEIERASGLPVVLWDERMTSAAAHRALRASGKSERARRGGAVDRVAAALLLESYLDALRVRQARAMSAAADEGGEPASERVTPQPQAAFIGARACGHSHRVRRRGGPERR